VQVACTRCGTFITGPSAFELGSRRWCADCVKLLVRDVRLWPVGYVIAVGVLLNFVSAAVLMALNWGRLGEPTRARMAWVVTVLGLGVFAVIVAKDTPTGFGYGVNVGVTLALVQAFRAPWKTLKAAGVRRANLWLPVLLTVIIATAFAIAVMFATGDLAEVLRDDPPST
jgi:hypothetical protein